MARVADRLLGRDVGGGAEHLPGQRQLVLEREPRDPEVGHRRRPRSSSSRLPGLTSRWTTPASCAASSATAASRSQRSAVSGGIRSPLQPVGDRAAAEQLHDHERAAVVLADVVDRDDVRVVGEPCGGARLALEAAAGALVLGEMGGEELDRHGAASSSSCGLPDARPSRRWRCGARRGSARAGRCELVLTGGTHAPYPRASAAMLPRRMARFVTPAGRARVRAVEAPLDGGDEAPVRPEPAEGADHRGRRSPARVRLHALPQGRQGHQGLPSTARRLRRGRSEPDPLPRRGRGRAGATRGAPSGGQRPQRVPRRRRRHGRQHGADPARRAWTSSTRCR